MLILESKISHQTLRLLRLEKIIITAWAPAEEKEGETIPPTALTTNSAGARVKAHVSES